MTRVVLDTNIIVSALLQPLGPSAQILVLVIEGSIELCMTGDLYAEYEEVLKRPRLKLSEETVSGVLQEIRSKGRWVRPVEKLHICADPDDDIFLE